MKHIREKTEHDTIIKNETQVVEDNFCDLDPTKICDNCFKCLETDSDYASVEIDGIYMNGERIY